MYSHSVSWVRTHRITVKYRHAMNEQRPKEIHLSGAVDEKKKGIRSVCGIRGCLPPPVWMHGTCLCGTPVSSSEESTYSWGCSICRV